MAEFPDMKGFQRSLEPITRILPAELDEDHWEKFHAAQELQHRLIVRTLQESPTPVAELIVRRLAGGSL
jgi:hypothetical protein